MCTFFGRITKLVLIRGHSESFPLDSDCSDEFSMELVAPDDLDADWLDTTELDSDDAVLLFDEKLIEDSCDDDDFAH